MPESANLYLQKSPNGHARRSTALSQVLELQDRILEATKVEGVNPCDLAMLARAWECLENRRRILRGKPLPGSLKPDKPAPKKAKQPAGPSFTES